MGDSPVFAQDWTVEAADTQPLVAELRDELAAVARARTRLAVNPAELPVLMSRIPEDGGRDGVFDLLETGCLSLDTGIREAAQALLADTDERWKRNLKTRMTSAARLVGIQSYNTFRDRSRVGGMSHYDDLLTTVALAIIDHTSERSTPEPGTGRANPATPAPTDRAALGSGALSGVSRTWLAFTGITLTLVLAITGLGLSDHWNRGPGAPNRSSPSRRLVGCDIPLAGSMDPVTTPRNLLEVMERTFEDIGATEGAGCPRHSVEQWEDLWLQHLAGGADSPPGFVMVHPDSGTNLWVEASLIETYRRSLRGGLRQLDGYPVESGELEGRPFVRLSLGGVIVAHAAGGPSFWAPGPAFEAWLTTGGPGGPLGMPMTDVGFVDGTLRQDYEGGYLQEGDSGEVETVETTQADVDTWLDAAIRLDEPGSGPDDSAGAHRAVDRIARSIDGTAWWIDGQAIRRWIPDGETWTCLGGDAAVLHTEMPGWVIASYPPGEGTATCETKP